jgi:hypothetical protein
VASAAKQKAAGEADELEEKKVHGTDLHTAPASKCLENSEIHVSAPGYKTQNGKTHRRVFGNVLRSKRVERMELNGMLRSMLKVAAAMGGFAVVHSVLASKPAKGAAAKIVGDRNRNGLYRVFFIGQSLASFAVLAEYIRRQPNREIYNVQGPFALLLHAGQVAAVGYAVLAARQVGTLRITDLESFEAWLGDGPVPAEPEAQGPALDARGHVKAAGPFALSRHPLNFAPIPILWLWPRMTTNLLAFNSAATVYLVVGSWHEEARLRHAYGERYIAYQHSGVPFYSPWPVRSIATSLEEARKPLLGQEK